MNHKSIVSIETDINRVVFGYEGGGFPTLIAIKELNGSEVKIIESDIPLLTMKLGDGRKAAPFITKDFQVVKSKFEEAERIEFNKIPWRDETGTLLKDFYLSLRYEFWPDGTAFINSFFIFDSPGEAPSIKSFRLEYPLNLSEYDRVHSAYIRRQETIDPNVMNGSLTQRFVENKNDCFFSNELLPVVNFSCRGRAAAYIEFLMEGHAALSGKKDGVCSGISWNKNKPAVYWDFQCVEHQMKDRPWQWRNQWAWIIAPPPRVRHLPPLRMYHYFDNFKLFPTDRQIEKMAKNGADLLIMHENWRLDMQNGGIPRDSVEFKRVVEKAHSLNMRIAVYIRGSEKSATEEFCDWFDAILRKDWDGLYMDYGGAENESSPSTETFPGGCCHFRRHFMKLRNLRRRVGRNGVLLSHTGPVFSPIGMLGGNVDGYVSGEGERGIMIKGRAEHEYFSSAFAVNGSMWIAAFPEYGTSKMIPFLAATGQFPHVSQGTQFPSSSLSHPNEPGINIIPFRPLWKLWGLFRNQQNLSVFNDYNSAGIFTHGDKDTAAYLMVSNDKKSALLIVSDFMGQPHKLEIVVDWKSTGFNPEGTKRWQMVPDIESPGKAEPYTDKTKFTVTVDSYGVAGWFLTHDLKSAQIQLDEYEKPYPEIDDADQAYLKKVESQKQMCDNPIGKDKIFLQIATPTVKNSYEDSMWWELYKNAIQIGTFGSDGSFKPLGWISKNGFTKNEPKSEDYVWPNHHSEWIPLHEIFPIGEHLVGLKSIQNGSPFYSFITATISPEAKFTDKSYTIRFFNELEPDRAYLRFKIRLTHGMNKA